MEKSEKEGLIERYVQPITTTSTAWWLCCTLRSRFRMCRVGSECSHFRATPVSQS